MVLKLEDSEINIDGRSVVRGIIGLQIFIWFCRAMYRAEKRYSAKLDAELKAIRKEQKLAKKQSKKS